MKIDKRSLPSTLERKRKSALAIRDVMSINGKKGATVRWAGHIKIVKSSVATKYSKDPLVQLQKRRFERMRYKARKINAEGSHTFTEWLGLKQKFNNMCLCCKRIEPEVKLTEDHIMPLSMGGSDYIENIQPLCQSCNTRKNAKFVSYLPSSSILNPNGERRVIN